MEKEQKEVREGEKSASCHESPEKSKKSSKQGKEKDAKERKHKEVLKDANGNDLKRPLTAYMLFNNFRRPVLQKDHPGRLRLTVTLFRLLIDGLVEADRTGVEKLE